jgi:cytochrome P450
LEIDTSNNLLSRTTTNPSKICFWILAHVLHNPVLLSSVRKEITPTFSHHGLDIKYLTTQCPLLDATFNEALRLLTTASSARNVEAPTTVNGNLLVPPAKILIPARQLHYDEEFFGPNTRTFDPYRFLNNKELQKSPAFKPFGGGLTLCSGRFVAKAQVLALAAVVLMRSDWEVVDMEGGVPRLDLTKPTLGVMDPVEGDDVLLRSRSSDGDA